MASNTDDDDSVSITSTVPSEPREEYLVDKILGEREHEGVREYFVMWEGYPDYRCTWEPETNFSDSVIIPNWEHTKMRVKRGLQTEFDLTALEQKIDDWQRATELRKLRRREKRKRLGLPVADSDSDEEQAQDEDVFIQDQDEQDEQDQRLTEETLAALNSRHKGEKQSVSDVSQSNLDENGDVPLISSSDSTAGQSVSSDDDRPLVQKRTSVQTSKKPSYQGTQRPPKPTREGRSTQPDRRFRKEQTESWEDAAQPAKANKPASGFTKPPSSLNSRRTSMETSLKKPFKPLESKSQHVNPPRSNPLEVANMPKKRGRPVGWRKNPVPLDPLSKEEQQPRVIVKTANSSGKQKVAGKSIFQNWNKPITKKRISFVSAASGPENPSVGTLKNLNRYRNLATQHRFAKALRNEPPPRMEDLVLYNAKDGPPKPGAKPLPPFQQILANLTTSSSAGPTKENQRRASLADTEESSDSPNNISGSGYTQSPGLPLTTKPQKAVIFAEPDNVANSPVVPSTKTRKTVMFAEPEEIPTSPVTSTAGTRGAVPFAEPELISKSPVDFFHQETRAASGTKGISTEDARKEVDDQVDSDPMVLSPDYSLSENVTINAMNKTVSDAQRLINSWGFQNPPSTRPDPSTRRTTSGSRFYRPRSEHKSQDDNVEGSMIKEVSSLKGERGQTVSDQASTRHDHTQDTREIAPSSNFTPAGSRLSSRGAREQDILEDTPAAFPWNQIRGNVGQDLRQCVVFGSIYRGEDLVTDIAFKGLPFAARTLFLSIKVPPKAVDVRLRHVCTADNYKRYFHTDEPLYFGAGYVHALEARQPKVEELAEDLRLHGVGGLFFAKGFSMLVFPTGTEEWHFLDRQFHKEVDPETEVSLRFVMFLPIPEFLNLKTGEVPFNDSPLQLTSSESTICRLFREVYHIDYKTLIQREKKGTEAQKETFFVMYPVFKKEEHDLLVSFLEANNATVYSSYTPTAWDFVLREVHDAVILIHTQYPALHTIPSLWRAMRPNRQLFHPFFHITLDLSLTPPELEKSQHLTRLFPCGGAILFTDSFILTQPAQALRILNWLVLRTFPHRPPGTWKLALRPRFRDWLLKIVEKLDPPKGNPFMEIYAVLYKLLPLDLMDDDTDFEIPKAVAPVVTPRHLSNFDPSVGLGTLPNEIDVMRRNDERLVDWYAGWARTKVYSIRRLHVVYSDQVLDKEQIKKAWRRKWYHLAFWTAEECLREHDIPKWERESKREDEVARDKRERRERMMADWTREREEKKKGGVGLEVREVQV